MKRVFGWWVLVMVLAVSTTASAQPPTAAATFANVQQLYANAKHFTAKFRQTVTNTTFGTTTTSDGALWVHMPSDVRADYTVQKSGSAVVIKSFVFDGKTLWLVDHVNKQIVKIKPTSNVLPAAVSFVTGGGALASQFAAAFVTRSWSRRTATRTTSGSTSPNSARPWTRACSR